MEYKWDQKMEKRNYIQRCLSDNRDQGVHGELFQAYRKELTKNVWNAIDIQDKGQGRTTGREAQKSPCAD